MYINNYRYLEKPPTFLYAAQKFSERLAGDPEGRTFKSDNSSYLAQSKQKIPTNLTGDKLYAEIRWREKDKKNPAINYWD